jgi:hypothetical protein
MRRRATIILLFIFCYSLILYRWQKISIDDENTQARVGVYGDAFSSRNVHSAAMWFKDIGYRKTKGLPVFGYTGNFNQQQITEVYTHYPPLPDILGGLYARVLHTKDARTLQLILILISVIFFFFLLKVLEKIIPGKNAAFISWVLLVTSCYFICWADDLHQHLYTELFKWLFIWLLYRFYTEHRKRWMLPALCCIYFIQAWLTFESIPFLAIVTIGFSWIFERKLFSFSNILLLAMPVLGVGLHLYQDYLYLGTWTAVKIEMKNAALKRLTGTGEWSNELGRALTFKDFVRLWTYEVWFRIGRMFALPGISFIIIATISLAALYKKHKLHFKMAIVFFLAGIAWIFIMPQHAVIHTFTIKHWAVFFAFVSGYGILRYLELLKIHIQTRQYYLYAFHILFIGFTLYEFIQNQVYYVWLKFGFVYPHFGTQAHLW